MTRRIRVVTLRAVFTSDAGAVNIEDACFKEDSDLMAFLESPYARLAYAKHCLIPSVREHTAEECRQRLLDPPPDNHGCDSQSRCPDGKRRVARS